MATNVFGPGSRYIVLGEVHCTGTETDLLECSHTGIGDHFCGNFVRKGIMSSEHDTDVAISCYGMHFMFLYLHHFTKNSCSSFYCR